MRPLRPWDSPQWEGATGNGGSSRRARGRVDRTAVHRGLGREAPRDPIPDSSFHVCGTRPGNRTRPFALGTRRSRPTASAGNH
jgi:hypothetical protein